MNNKKQFTIKITNEIDSPAPTTVWGYKGVPGKGGNTKNSIILTKKETD